MTHLDLFTGIGGFHLAAGWAGFETIGFSEVEPYCCALLAERWPEIPNYGDIRTADFSGFRGRITVLSAGVPCQPASLAGKRRGERDDRWLWDAVLDVVGTVQPAWCLLENPPGILTLDEFARILLRLESLGYQIRAFSVPANAVGAKHRRMRVFIVANRNGERLEGAEYVGQRNSVNQQSIDMGGEALADVGSQRCEKRQKRDSEPQQSGFEASCGNDVERCSPALADADRAGLEEHESRQPGECATAVGSSGPDGAGEFESRIRRVAHDVPYWPYGPMPSPLSKERIPNRSHRLKALGNACCPYQCLPFFAAIAQAERGSS